MLEAGHAVQHGLGPLSAAARHSNIGSHPSSADGPRGLSLPCHGSPRGAARRYSAVLNLTTRPMHIGINTNRVTLLAVGDTTSSDNEASVTNTVTAPGDADAACYLAFTSGTTGAPKGTMHSTGT